MKQRPVGVILLAIWFFLQAMGQTLLGGIAAFFVGDILGAMGMSSALRGAPQTTLQIFQILFILIGVLLVGGGLGYGISAIGLLMGKEWGRIVGILACTAAAIGWFGIFVPFIVLPGGTGFLLTPLIIGIITAVVNALPILYLISNEVRQYCSEDYGAYPVTTSSVSVSPVTVSTSPAQQTYAPPQPQIPPTEVIGAVQPPTAWLVMRAGNRSGKQYGLRRGRNVIGRDATQCEVIVDDSTVSKRHAEIRYENGQFVLYDLASTNGTFVNNRRVQRQGLLDGDDVRLGHVTFVFKQVKIGHAN